MTSSRRLLILLSVFAVLLIGCSPREHSNPFDPENEETNGAPDFLSALAGNEKVTLRWGLSEFNDLRHMRLVRVGNGSSIVVADSLTGLNGIHIDRDVENEFTYQYTLEVFFSGQDDPLNVEPAIATPGPRVLWVLDQNSGGPTLVSADGRVRVALPGRGRPSDFDVDPGTGEVTSVDFFNRRIESFDRDGNPAGRQEVLTSPLSIALVPEDGSVWVGHWDPSGITRWNADLSFVMEADTLEGVAEDLAYDPARGDLWIADSEQGRVVHRRADGTRTSIVGFVTPFSLALDAGTGDAWLVDRLNATVHRIDRETDSIEHSNSGFGGAFQVVSDGTGGAWVTDNTAGRLVHLDSAAVFIESFNFLDEPTGIAVDPGTGDLWVTNRGVRDELVRVTPAGLVLSRSEGFGGPFAVAVAVPEEEADSSGVARRPAP